MILSIFLKEHRCMKNLEAGFLINLVNIVKSNILRILDANQLINSKLIGEASLW